MRLKTPKFVLTNNINKIASFECFVSHDRLSIDCERITFSKQYDFTDSQIDDVLVHEMIHYYLCVSKVDMECGHGPKFMEMADLFNRTFYLNIMEYNDGTVRKKEGYSKLREFFSFLEF
jgi:hypothetical protein